MWLWIPQRNLVFLPFIRMPKNVNFSDPASEVGEPRPWVLFSTHCQIAGPSWHQELLPRDGAWSTSRSLASSSKQSCWALGGQGLWLVGRPTKRWQVELFWSRIVLSFLHRTVVLYLHGNTAHRAGEHRKELYQVHFLSDTIRCTCFWLKSLNLLSCKCQVTISH